MENFPYLLTLFIFTIIAVVAYANYTRQEADEASEGENAGELRMAAPRSPAGRVMKDSIRERRAEAHTNT